MIRGRSRAASCSPRLHEAPFDRSPPVPCFFSIPVSTHVSRYRLPAFLFSITRVDTFVPDEIIGHRRDPFAHTDHARVYCLQTPCAEGVPPATPNVVRVSSDRTSDRRTVDAALDQRLANPGERPNKFQEMVHPLLTIGIGRCPDGSGRARHSGGAARLFAPRMLPLLRGVAHFYSINRCETVFPFLLRNFKASRVPSFATPPLFLFLRYFYINYSVR